MDCQVAVMISNVISDWRTFVCHIVLSCEFVK